MSTPLFILRSRLLSRLFGIRATLWALDRLKENPRLYATVLVGELFKSRSPRYSCKLLEILAVLPDDLRETDDTLKRFFVAEELNSASVRDGLKVCSAALKLCGGARI
jgi:hypothetical protein